MRRARRVLQVRLSAGAGLRRLVLEEPDPHATAADLAGRHAGASAADRR